MNSLIYNNFDAQDPLDFLDQQLKGKPRSSLDEKE